MEKEIETLEKKRNMVTAELEEAHRRYGQWVQSMRFHNGLSLRVLAEKIGVTAPYLHDIEKCRRHASKRVRDAITNVFARI